ncbi:MAG: pyrroloquinoline-quinone synthase [Candidatus Binatota bacterium]|nr:pyrroloquinoline-quinone synthase [Candidatus Binatota bacterium]
MQVLTKEQLEEKIFEIIGRTLPKDVDPFWMQLFEGSLPLDGVRHWAKQMYFITQEFGRYTSAIHANCDVFEVRHVLAETLWEEHGRMVEKKDHPELFRKFTRAIGIADEELALARPLPETEALLDGLLDLCLHRHFVESLAGFGIAVEGQATKGIPIFIHVFRHKYGLDDEAIEFWTTHAEDDEVHGRRSLEIVLEHATTPTLQQGVLDCVRKSMERLMLFHHGIGRGWAPREAERLSA